MNKIEYRVRPVTRYIVTKFSEDDFGNKASQLCGMYDNEHIAYEVGYALCKADHDRTGYAPGDERIQYPQAIGPKPLPVDLEVRHA